MKKFLSPLKLTHHLLFAATATALVAGCTVAPAQNATTAMPQDVTRVPVTFSGGHETLRADRGRPVVLIAAALGVAPATFREAFSRVTPAGPGRGPTDDEARQNKAALLNALGKYGVTNERLDEVSDFYRYPPGRGGIWKNAPARADALVKDGAIIGYEIADGGAGYSSPPQITVPGFEGVKASVKLAFGENLRSNGAVKLIALPPHIPLQVGDSAPDFELTSLSGEPITLAATLEKGPVVLVMLRGYPGYQCPICNAQVGQMINKAAQLQDAGAQVLLVYPGPADGLKARADEFVQGKDIPANFNLLLDPDYAFTNLYNLRWDAKGETSYPSTFVLDKDGQVLFAKVSHEHGDRAKIGDVMAALPTN